MSKFLEEYGFITLMIVIIACIIFVATYVKLHNDKVVKENFSDFTDTTQTDIGGQGLGDGESGTDKGEGYKVPETNKENGKLKDPSIMW